MKEQGLDSYIPNSFGTLDFNSENAKHLQQYTDNNYRPDVMKRDIETREDLFMLLNKFYDGLLRDESISYIFTDVAKIDMKQHLPVIVDFWEMVLFDAPTYKKNAIQPHLILNQKSKFEKHHFDTWLGHFDKTVDELFEGNIAFMAKQRAKSIAAIMQIKIAQLK